MTYLISESIEFKEEGIKNKNIYCNVIRSNVITLWVQFHSIMLQRYFYKYIAEVVSGKLS